MNRSREFFKISPCCPRGQNRLVHSRDGRVQVGKTAPSIEHRVTSNPGVHTTLAPAESEGQNGRDHAVDMKQGIY